MPTTSQIIAHACRRPHETRTGYGSQNEKESVSDAFSKESSRNAGTATGAVLPAFTFEEEELRCLKRLSIFNGEEEARSSSAPVGRLSCSRLSRLPKLGGAEKRRRCLNSAGSCTGIGGFRVLVGGFLVLLTSLAESALAGVDAARRCVGRGIVLSLVSFRSSARDSASTMDGHCRRDTVPALRAKNLAASSTGMV